MVQAEAHGYGATPANWKGWVASIAFLGLVFLVPLFLWHRSKTREVPLAAGQFGVWALMVAVLVAGFVRLARTKTDGEWKWRWGKVGAIK